MPRKTAITSVICALAGLSLSASAEEIFLFEATPITDSGFSADINGRYFYDSAETAVFCDGPGTAHLRTVGESDNSLIVDNYVTLNDADGQSICTGGNSSLPVINGTNCFSSGSSSSTHWGKDIEEVFTSNATAPVSLIDGQNDLEFKLWDWGGVYGNTAVELALPENCSGSGTTNLCAAQDIDIGEVRVTNDGDYLYVEFAITEVGWYLQETHVAVGDSDDMQNRAGNPAPGRFPYACEALGELETQCEAKIPLADVGTAGETVDVAAHAVAYRLQGSGCDEDLAFASEVADNSQGDRKDGSDVLAERSDPTAVYSATDGAPSADYSFFSLGFAGSLTVGFGKAVGNGPGDDVCVQEVTNGRNSYPAETAEVFADTTLLGEVSNESGSAPGDGLECVDLPDGISTAEYISLLDTTDPTPYGGNADGYDIDWIAACYLAEDETAWGGACPAEDGEAEGTRFTRRGNWGTYFEYTIE